MKIPSSLSPLLSVPPLCPFFLLTCFHFFLPKCFLAYGEISGKFRDPREHVNICRVLRAGLSMGDISKHHRLQYRLDFLCCLFLIKQKTSCPLSAGFCTQHSNLECFLLALLGIPCDCYVAGMCYIPYTLSSQEQRGGCFLLFLPKCEEEQRMRPLLQSHMTSNWHSLTPKVHSEQLCQVEWPCIYSELRI